MAVLEYSVIKATPEATMDYICNTEKIIPGDSEDIHRVLNYMGDENSAERVYSFGHNCSANPKLARQQFALYRQKYYDFKNGAGVQGCSDDGKSEILALHFFLSYDPNDKVTPEIMNEISRRLTEETKLKDFPVLSANHFDKKHKHTHKLVGQYSAKGKPRKFAMKFKDFDDLRRKANHLCYEYGLSVIDLPELRRDKAYSDWLDAVISEGKVRVLPANGAGLKHKTERKGSYYRWLQVQEQYRAEEERRLTASQLKNKNLAKRSFYQYEGRYFPHSNGKQFYSVRRYENGRKRTSLELICILVHLVATGECEYVERNYPGHFVGRRDYNVQNMLDAIAAAREHQISTPNDVVSRIADVGKQMNALKIEKAKHESRERSCKDLFDAITAYNHFRGAVEGVENPPQQSKEIYDTAYSIMASHRCTTAEQIDEFLTRQAFSKKKIEDYEKRLAELKKQYRDLKKVEAISSRPLYHIDRIYALTADAQKKALEEVAPPVPKRRASLDSVIKNAEGKTSPRDNAIIEKNKEVGE